MGSEDNESQLFQSSSSRDVDLSNEWEQDTTAIEVGAINSAVLFLYRSLDNLCCTCIRGTARAPEVKILKFVSAIGTCDLYKPRGVAINRLGS